METPLFPLPNCNLILSKNKKIYLVTEKYKAKKLIFEKKIYRKQIIDQNKFENFNT